ncbi:MAG: hypothetical protein ACLUSP_04000 [Christensenellales bacterium]
MPRHVRGRSSTQIAEFVAALSSPSERTSAAIFALRSPSAIG